MSELDILWLSTRFGVRVRFLRNRLGLSKEALCEKCRFSRQLLVRIERDDTVPGDLYLNRLADVLGVSTEMLMMELKYG